MQSKPRFTLFCFSVFSSALLCLNAAHAAVWYVDKDNTGAEDGTSWSTAFNTIQEGIDAAYGAGGGEVWVAEGTYNENRTSPYEHETGSNGVVDTGSVLMKEGVHLYGGFIGIGSGGNESARDERNWQAHVTTIDASTARAGSPAYHVVIGASNAALDGFTVTGGNANAPQEAGWSVRSGGGMWWYSLSSLSLANCEFANNSADLLGGGMYTEHSSATLTNCTFLNNSSGQMGGAMCFQVSPLTILNCRFSGNISASYYGGGGICNMNGSPTLINCTFVGNMAPAATEGGGAIFNTPGSSPTIVNCSFIENWTNTVGGAIYSQLGTTPTLLNCILWGNSLPQVFDSEGDTTIVRYSDIQGGYLGEGNIDADPLFQNPANGDLSLKSVSPCIDYGTAIGAPTTDILGVSRSQGAGVDMGAYEFIPLPDSDGDGLPDVEEPGQGCQDSLPDAALFARIDMPSNGASFRSTPISLGGRISGGYVDAVVISTDGGATYHKVAVLSPSQLTWIYSWTPSATGTYSVKVKAGNVFGGYTTTGPISVTYHPNAPVAVITVPIADDHVDGPVEVRGSALAGQLGFGQYVLDYRAGTDPNAPSGWTTLTTSTSPVNDGVLYSAWNVSALAAGPYVLRLRVTDGAEVYTVMTYVVVRVDHDVTPPNAPRVVTIQGGIVAYAVANGNPVEVTGMAEAESEVEQALVINTVTQATLKDASSEITIHHNGSIRGTITLPSPLNAPQIALKLTVRDARGNVSPPRTSNFLTVDNASPDVTIVFPQNSATLPRDLIVVSGVAEDNGKAGLDKVEFSIDASTWYLATGTSAWAYNWTPPANAAYTVRVRATDRLGNAAEAQANVTINASYPSAYITSPGQGQDINEGAQVTVTGTANDATDFNFYKVQYAPGVSPAVGWVNVTSGNIPTPVINGTLITWNTTGLAEGVYTVRLIVLDDAMNSVIFDRLVNVVPRLSIAAIPDAWLFNRDSIEGFVHLPDYTTALSGDPETFTYTIVGNTDPDCGVSIDGGKNINIVPTLGWQGTSDVTVQATDGALTDTDTFTVTSTGGTGQQETCIYDGLLNDPVTGEGSRFADNVASIFPNLAATIGNLGWTSWLQYDLEYIDEVMAHHRETPGDALPDAFQLALIENALCEYSYFWDEQCMIDNFLANKATFAEDVQDITQVDLDLAVLGDYNNLFAGLLGTSTAMQNTIDALVRDRTGGAIGLPRLLEYRVFGVDCGKGLKDASEPFSGPGDLNGDGMTNAETYALVVASGGTMETFVGAASGSTPFWPGNPDLPLGSITALSVLVGAALLGGRALLKRKE